jgi:hypothetical protein
VIPCLQIPKLSQLCGVSGVNMLWIGPLPNGKLAYALMVESKLKVSIVGILMFLLLLGVLIDLY